MTKEKKDFQYKPDDYARSLDLDDDFEFQEAMNDHADHHDKWLAKNTPGEVRLELKKLRAQNVELSKKNHSKIQSIKALQEEIYQLKTERRELSRKARTYDKLKRIFQGLGIIAALYLAFLLFDFVMTGTIHIFS